MSAQYQQAQQELKEARAKARLLRTQIQVRQLERAKLLTESVGDWDWVAAYKGIFDRYKDEAGTIPGIMSTVGDRRYGRNFPLYRSEQELALIRMPSRVLCATNSYAQGLLHGVKSYVIGTGYTYRAVPRKRAAQQIDANTLTALCDWIDGEIEVFQRRNEWYGGEQPNLEEELFIRRLEDGEFLTVQWADPDGYSDLRVIDPEQLTQKPGGAWEEWSFGIRTDPNDVQRVLGYWLFFGPTPESGEEYDPCDVTHCRRNSKRSIKRGVPDFAWGTYEALDEGERLRRNATQGAAIQAAIVGVRQHEGATGAEIDEAIDVLADFSRTNPVSGAQERVTNYAPGSWLDVTKGMSFLSLPSSANQQSAIIILQACLRGAGRRWSAPEWIASGDSSNNNFASGMTAESPFVREILSDQRVCRSVYTRIHEVAMRHRCEAGKCIVAGRQWNWQDVTALIEIQCSAPSPETRNKLEEAQRRQIEKQEGAYSAQQWCADEGRDYDQITVEIEEHNERTGGTGVILPTEVP